MKTLNIAHRGGAALRPENTLAAFRHAIALGCDGAELDVQLSADGMAVVHHDFRLNPALTRKDGAWLAGETPRIKDLTLDRLRSFDLGRTFDFVFITANSLLHLQEAEDLVSCFRSVRRHLAPGARFVFDVFNPSVRLLAEADGVRRTRESLSFVDPDRGEVRVDVAETYDAAAQVTRGTWHFSTDSEPDFVVVPLEIRSIFPQELPLLVARGGLQFVDRLGDWSGSPFAGDASLQLCICQSA